MKQKKILITNDDGINAPGIELLINAAKRISSDITIIAPEREQSGKSQAMSLSDIIRLREIDVNVFSISGTPTDCVMLAIKQLMKDNKPDLILSGVNRGQNLADDVNYSGTIGAAMEGTTSLISKSSAPSTSTTRFSLTGASRHRPSQRSGCHRARSLSSP